MLNTGSVASRDPWTCRLVDAHILRSKQPMFQAMWPQFEEERCQTMPTRGLFEDAPRSSGRRGICRGRISNRLATTIWGSILEFRISWHLVSVFALRHGPHEEHEESETSCARHQSMAPFSTLPCCAPMHYMSLPPPPTPGVQSIAAVWTHLRRLTSLAHTPLWHHPFRRDTLSVAPEFRADPLDGAMEITMCHAP